MIAERKTQCESRHLRIEEITDLERRLVAAGWRNAGELARAADSFSIGLDDFSVRLCGVAVRYLRECGDENRKPSWPDAVEYLARFGISNVGDLYFILVDTPVPHDEGVTDLVQQVQRVADERTDEDCRYVTREVTLLILHALGCPHCQRCAEVGAASRHPANTRRERRQRKATVYV